MLLGFHHSIQRTSESSCHLSQSIARHLALRKKKDTGVTYTKFPFQRSGGHQERKALCSQQ